MPVSVLPSPALGDAAASGEAIDHLLHHVPGVIFQLRVDAHARRSFDYVSPSVSRLFGLTQLDALRDPEALWSRVPPAERAELETSLALAGASQALWSHDFPVQRAGAATRWLHAEASPQRLDDGACVWHGYLRDVTERKRAEQQTLETRALYRSLVESMPQAIYRADPQGRIEYANTTLLRSLGKALGEVVGQPAHELFPPPLQALHEAHDDAVRASGTAQTRVVSLPAGDDATTLEVLKIPLTRDDGTHAGIQGVLSDVSARVRQEAELQLAAVVFESSPHGVIITDAATRILQVNPAFEEITGWTATEVVGRTPAVLHSGRQPPAFYAAMWQALARQGRWEGELVNRRRDGSSFTEHLAVRVVRDAEGAVCHYVGTFSDVTERQRVAERIEYMAHHDALTGLPNRTLLRDRVDRAIEAARRHGGSMALLFMDLDRFKRVNDTLGHGVGDQLLVEASLRLTHAVRASDTVCRQGGDEFIVLLAELDQPDHAMVAAQHILQALRAPYDIQGHSMSLSASIGIAVYPDDGADIDTLLKHADVAMYAAKRQGRDAAQYYQAGMNQAAVQRATVETELRAALQRGELFIELQPQVRLPDAGLAGFEALVRWAHPHRGRVPPGEFIEVAEDCGLIVELEKQVLRLACAARAALRAHVDDTCRVSVNVSPPQFRQPGFTAFVQAVLRDTGLPAHLLELELTERLLMADTDRVMATLQELDTLGIALAIDDFGTGYSSMSYLRRFPIRKLKIDLSFVRDMEAGPSGAAICQAIVSMGHSLGMAVTAEGVETPAQAAQLAAMDCDEAQGWLYGRPMAADVVPGWCGSRTVASI